MRRLILLLLVALFVVPGTAAASPYVRYGLQDDAWLQFGPGTLEQRIARLGTIGVRLVRFSVRWDAVAAKQPADATSPDDPAYDWSGPDAVLQGLRDHGIAVVVTLLGTPSWANGGRTANWAPTGAQDFHDFAVAAATRYGWVRDWLIWNEPNQQRWLRPTTPQVYVERLLNPGYEAIHSVIPRAEVGGGVTAPRGGPGGVAPVDWIVALGREGAKLDAYAHHPYPSSPAETPFSGGCDHCRTITMATLPRLLSLVAKTFGPSKRIWLTEYGYQTRPPDPFGVTPQLQARYIGEGALRAYEAPRVDMLIQYLYRDEPDLARFQSGLFWLSGKAKPALQAFELPLAEVSRNGAATTVWGQLRLGVGAQRYRLEEQSAGGDWHAVGAAATTNPHGFFRRVVRAPAGTLIRVVALGDDFPGWPLLVR